MCTFTWTYIISLMSYMSLERCMSVILILHIFIVCMSNCLSKYRLDTSGTDLLFLTLTICIKCRSSVCWGCWGCMWPCSFVLPLAGSTFDTVCPLLCNNIQKKERRGERQMNRKTDGQTDQGRPDWNSQVQVCSRFRTIILLSSLNLVLEICQDLSQLREI